MRCIDIVSTANNYMCVNVRTTLYRNNMILHCMCVNMRTAGCDVQISYQLPYQLPTTACSAHIYTHTMQNHVISVQSGCHG